MTKSSATYESWSIERLENHKNNLFKDYQKFYSKSKKAFESFNRIREILNQRYDELESMPLHESPTHKECQARITPKERESVEKELIAQGK